MKVTPPHRYGAFLAAHFAATIVLVAMALGALVFVSSKA